MYITYIDAQGPVFAWVKMNFVSFTENFGRSGKLHLGLFERAVLGVCVPLAFDRSVLKVYFSIHVEFKEDVSTRTVI